MKLPKFVLTLDEALAAVDSPAAVAERHKQAEALVDDMLAHRPHEFYYSCRLLTITERNAVDQCLRTDHVDVLGADRIAKQYAEAARVEREGVIAQTESAPAPACKRSKASTRTRPGTRWKGSGWPTPTAVQSVAWQQGNRSPDFTVKFRQLIQDRDTAEADGDDDEVRTAEARLFKLTGIPFPKEPGCYWDAADTLPESSRQDDI